MTGASYNAGESQAAEAVAESRGVGAVRLAELTRGVGELDGDGSIEVTGLAIDSRDVHPGALFVCLRGLHTDGHRFIGDALARGAAAVVVETPIRLEGVAVLRVAATQAALAILACRFYGDPSHELELVGVTGTNGKTTVTHLVAAALEASGRPTAIIGTIGAGFRGDWRKLPYTTPTADRFQAELRRLADAGARAVAAEISSHALKTQRSYGTRFRAVGFTNLTRDHLDFHGSEADYLASKLGLFDRRARGDAAPVTAVVNVDDPRGEEFSARARAGGDPVVTVGRRHPADVGVDDLELDQEGSRGVIVSAHGRHPFELALPGAFNVENALVAFGLAVAAGADPGRVVQGMATVSRIPGRLERVDRGGPVRVFVDFAHTPDALETVLSAVRGLSPRRLVAVFGCGGDRDRGKRPQMAEVGCRLADHVVLTSDNPRSEDPEVILDDMAAGVPPGASCERLADRRLAIRRAIALAEPGDVVVIAGKGHELTQLIGDRVVPFDDREEAAAALASGGDQEGGR